MRVKVGDTWYEATPETPIMVELTMKDKVNIGEMLPEANRYALFAKDSHTPEEAKAWMDEGAQPLSLR